VDETENVGALKAKIEAAHSHPVAAQKIIYAGRYLSRCASPLLKVCPGKILSDDKVIGACGIKEKDFLVLMVSKV